MSRIIYPSTFEQQRTLLQNILNKHNTDGATSVIKPLMIQKNIDLTADVVAGTIALNHESARLLLTKQSQNYCELRDIIVNRVFTHVKNCSQYLKSFYKPNFKGLGDWGTPIDTNGKITYPADVKERIALFKALKKKHDGLPNGESPLLPYLTQNNINLTVDEADITKALGYHDSFQQSAKASENETEQRDLVWQPVVNHLRTMGDFLKKLNNDNTKALGLWGFVIDSSTRQPKERTSTIKPGEKVTISGVVLGSSLVNSVKVTYIYTQAEIQRAIRQLYMQANPSVLLKATAPLP